MKKSGKDKQKIKKFDGTIEHVGGVVEIMFWIKKFFFFWDLI